MKGCTRTLVLLIIGLSFAWKPLQAQSFSVTSNGSDYYLYFRWTEAYNACWFYPWSQYRIRANETEDLHVITNSDGDWYAPANTGNAYYHEAGPLQQRHYQVIYHHYGTGCAYGDTVIIQSGTAALRPPTSLSATDNAYDSKVVLSWGASTTDVPQQKYQYRIYRDNVLMATVASNVLTWADNTAEPGVTYQYAVATYAKDWNQYSTRVTDNGSVFDLNVRTESLASGVKIIWDRESSDFMSYNKFTIERKDGDNPPDFLTSVTSTNATSWTDPNTGGLPLPGYTYTYVVTPESNDGDVYRSASALGSRLPDGSVSGYVKAPFGGGVQGVAVTATRNDDVPQGDSRTVYSDTTDANGYYEIKGIYYYDEASFAIVPSMENHGFRPVSEDRTLSLSNNTITDLNFTDTSSFTVNCHVQQVFAGDTLNMSGVEIRADGIPRGYLTGTDGQVMVTVAELGTHSFEPYLRNHTYAPSDTDLYITDDVALLSFFDTTLFTFSGSIKGPCDIKIGTAQVRLFDSAGVVDTIFTTNSSGEFRIDVPGKKYSVLLHDFTPDNPQSASTDAVLQYLSDTVHVDMDTGAVTHDFVYRKAPTILVSGFERTGCGGTYDGIPIVEQGQPVSLQITVRENFGSADCLVDSGFVVVTHTLDGGVSTTDTVVLEDGTVAYEIIPGLPNIVAPYLYTLEMTAHTGNVTDQFSTQVLVIGNRPREQTFASVSPQLPFLLLRDPPGDGSYSYLAKNTTISTAVSFFSKMESAANVWQELKLGVKYEAGQFVFTEFAAWGQLKTSLTMGASLTSSTELSLDITTSELFTTSDNSDITGTQGDVFVGAALNLVYAITDIIEYDTTSCQVSKDKQLIMGSDGFKTTFMYTEDHIRNTLIPQLEQIRDLYQESNPDSAVLYQSQISVWEQTLARNDTLKNNALFIENRSFSANAPYENSLEVTAGATQTVEFVTFVETSIAAEVGMEVGGSGGGAGVEGSFRMEIGASAQGGVSHTHNTGYVLSDDDAGDFFSVDVLADLVYATPVFKLVGGRSSCPWEHGTQPRDGVQLSADTYSQMDVVSTDAGVFTLTLANTSQSDEERTYNLWFAQETNPNGAVLTLGGSQIQGGLPTPFTIPADSTVTTTVTVRKGPSAYEYNGLRFVLSSPCDGAIYDDIELSVTFCDTCVSEENLAPVIATKTLDSADLDEPYTFTLVASDPDSNAVLWYVVDGPERLNLDVISGVITWTPTIDDLGENTLKVRATDGVLSDTATYALQVGTGTLVRNMLPIPKVLSLSATARRGWRQIDLAVGVPSEEKLPLTLKIFDISGRVVRKWVIDGAGYHFFSVDGEGEYRRMVGSGMYIAQLSGSSKVLQKKLVMAR